MLHDIEQKVRHGQEQLDQVKIDIENSMGDLRPQIKDEIAKMGQELHKTYRQIQEVLKQVESGLDGVHHSVPNVQPEINEYGRYVYYIGLGMSCLVLLVLSCHILGLFYGFCGKRPGNVYGDDCCNRGTGANWLLAGVYLTFLFSLVLLVLTTSLFLVGSLAEKGVCEALHHPNDSEVFQVIDEKFIQPFIHQQYQGLGLDQDSLSRVKDQVSLRNIIHNVS